MEVVLCKRVLITSRGWTAKVEIVPAERPAIVSTSAGERRAWFSFISKGDGLVLSWLSRLDEETKYLAMTKLKLFVNSFCRGFPTLQGSLRRKWFIFHRDFVKKRRDI